MKPFSLVSPPRVSFGAGAISGIASVVESLVERGGEGKSARSASAAEVLVLSDRGVAGTGVPASISSLMESAGFAARIVDTVPPEPTDEDLDSLAVSISGKAPKAIVAVGGGSVMDAAKVLSALAESGWTTAELFERGAPRGGIPVVAVPTTAGTGSESTYNAIVLFPKKSLKIGLVSPFFIPDRVVLDPELTLGLPPRLTASTGLDAFCHLLECFISKKANPVSDMMAKEGMRLLAQALPAAYSNGADIEARSAVMLSAYYGGACIASSSTTAVHALSYPLGGTYRIPHGVANAILLMPVMRYQAGRIAEKLAEAARAIGIVPTGDGARDAEAFIDFLGSLVERLGIPKSLSELGVPTSALDELARAAFGVRRLLDNNPVELSIEDIRAIYETVK